MIIKLLGFSPSTTSYVHMCAQKRSQDYSDFTAKVREQLEKGLGPVKLNESHPEHVEITKILYQQYTQRFINDNNKIWATGNIFIPLSLAGLLSIEKLTIAATALVAFSSIALLWFWVVVAENHRAFQNRSQAVTEEIERHFGFDVAGGKLDSHSILRHAFCTVQRIRWTMFYLVFFIWLAAFASKLFDTYELSPPSFTKRATPSQKVLVQFNDRITPLPRSRRR